MPGDPKECRLHALRCAELAGTARPQQLKATLLELAKNWEKLAVDLQRTQSLVDEVSVNFKRPAEAASVGGLGETSHPLAG
jgi:hypothetical protein